VGYGVVLTVLLVAGLAERTRPSSDSHPQAVLESEAFTVTDLL
jgi:hypothetical protein